ncbi:MAG: S8 family serine peptidase [Bacteroidia bacterium]|nr:S8 family serine peptidase [Bacteroidia bacterium]
MKFKDKNGTPYSLSNPSAFLTQKSIDRRSAYNISYHVTDLPVNPTYISSVDGVPGVSVLYASKWLNGVIITIDTSVLKLPQVFSQIKAFSFVSDTNTVRRYRLDYLPVEADPSLPGQRPAGETTETSKNPYGGSRRQINQLNLGCYHELGFKGQGMTIGVLDAGYSGLNTGPVFDSLRSNNRILGTRNFVDGGTNVYLGSNHGTGVMSCLAANIPGIIMGTAPYANYWLIRSEEGAENISEEYNWIRGAEFADSVGVDILTTSLGYTTFDLSSSFNNHTHAQLDGRTAPMSIAANLAARKGIFVLNAAGNEAQGSWKKIGVPADADSICTVGAVDSLGKYGLFSSVGPTADGRIKPDLSAMGVFTWVSGGTLPGQPGDGTSFATPVLAGAVACFWQMNKSLKNIAVLDTLKKLGSLSASPNYSLGWGIPKFPCPCLLKADFTYRLEGKRIVSFKSSSTGALSTSTYTWSFGDGSQDTENQPAHNFPMAHTPYPVFVTVNNESFPGCVDTSEVKMIMPHPDPTLDFDFYADCDQNSVFRIALTPAVYESVYVEIIDMNGRVMVSKEMDPDIFNIEFNASGFANYMYLVKIKTSKGTKTKKILKR